MPRTNDLRTQCLDLLRFPLAVVVLLIHTFTPQGFIVHGTNVSFESLPLTWRTYSFVEAFLKSQSVPIYYFISGYVFFLGIRTFNREVYFRKLKNRMHSLLIPYVIWNMLMLLMALVLFLPCFSTILPNIHLNKLDFNPGAILNTFWDQFHGVIRNPNAQERLAIYPQNIPLWFVRELMIVVLCTPVIHFLLHRLKCYFVIALGIVWFIIQGFHEFSHLTMILTAFFFFSWGAYMSVNNKDMIQEFGRFSRVSMVLYPALGILYMMASGQCPEAIRPIKACNIVVGLFFAYNLAAYLLRHRICQVNPFLASSSFFLYISHWLIYDKSLKVVFFLFRPQSDLGMLMFYALSVAFTVGLLLATYFLLRRFAPGLLKVIAGRK